MKVAVLAAGAEGTLGGETRVAFELAEALSGKVETAFIFTGPRNRVYKEGNLTKVSLKGGEIGENEIPVYSRETIQYFFNFLSEYKPDILHSHSIAAAPFLGQVWSIMNNVPFVYTTHFLPSRLASFFGVDENMMLYKFLNEKVFKEYYLEFLNNCSTIIALNEVAKSDVYSYGYSGKSYIIPNGRFLDKLSSLKVPSLKEKQKKMIFIGRVSIRKNQEYLIKVMEYLPSNYLLTLVGDFFSDDYRKAFTKIAKRYKNVEVMGGISPDKIPGELEKAHLFVSASKAEVQALSVIEAMAAGRPVVGLSNETIDELVDSKVGERLSKHTTPKDFAKSVMEILEGSEESYLELTRNARERVKELDWDIVADKTVDVYKMVVDDYRKEGGRRRRNVNKLIDLVPDFLGKQYIIEQVEVWNELIYGGKKDKKTWKKVPGKTLVFAGLTVGTVAVVYHLLRAVKSLKRKPVK